MRTLEDIVNSIPEIKSDTEVNWEKGLRKHNFDTDRNYWMAKLSARCNFDFPFFTEYVLGCKLSEFHKEPVQFVYNSRAILIIWARGHLKTTIWSECYSIWRLWKENGIEIAITSSALEQSQKIIENIESRIEGNEFLKELIPKNRQETWNKSQLNTENGNKCFQKPFNSSTRGTHVDYYICDDILREENLSQEQIKDFFWSIIYPCTQTRKGQLLVVGTPMTMKDLFAEIRDMPEWKIIKRACVYTDDNGKWLKPVWHEKFTLEELENIKSKMGSLRFEREYMCNPMGGGATIFKNIRIGKHSELDKPLPTEDYFIGLDVAMREGPKNDFTVFSILGKDTKTGMIRQRKMERYKGWTDDEIIKRMRILNQKFRPKRILIENAGISVGLVKNLQNKIKYPDVADVVDGFVSNKRERKEEIISAISVGFETGVLDVLDNTIQYNELCGFKAKEDRSGKVTYEGVGEHDDCLRKGALINTDKGLKKIEDIKVGDCVLTHKGRYKRVWRTIKKPYNGHAYRIKPYGGNEITVTKEHPILVVTKSSKGYPFYKCKWVLPTKLKRRRLLYPIFKEYKNTSYSDGFLKLMGLFLADGCYRENGEITIALNDSKKKELIKFVIDTVEKEFNLKAKVHHRKNQHCCVVQFNSKKLVTEIFSKFGKREIKRLPITFVNIEPHKEIKILEGWLSGDGYADTRGWTIGATISREIANQMHNILLRNGICPNLRTLKRTRYGKENKMQYWVEFKKNTYNNRRSRIDGGYKVSAIQRIKEITINEDVYNIEVEDDESYVVENTIVHNCVIALGLAMVAIQMEELGTASIDFF